MFVSKIDVNNLTYDTNKTDLCKSLSTNFEKIGDHSFIKTSFICYMI